MMHLHRNCFGDQTPADVEERLLKWGGVPRNVFTHAALESAGWMKEVENVLAATDPRVLESSISLEQVSKGDSLSNRVFLIQTQSQLEEGGQLTPDDVRFYQFGRIAICSEWAASFIVKSFIAREEYNARRLLAQCCVLGGSAATIGGRISEQLTLEALRRGGQFLIRRLKATRTTTSRASRPSLSKSIQVSLDDFRQHFSGLASPAKALKAPDALPDQFYLVVPAMSVDGLTTKDAHPFKSMSTIRDDPSCTLVQVPLSKTFCAIDLLLGLVPCNVTIDSSHTIALAGKELEANIGLLGVLRHLSSLRGLDWESAVKSRCVSSCRLVKMALVSLVTLTVIGASSFVGRIPFIWITPEERFAKFKSARSFTIGDEVVKNHDVKIHVDQFVLCLPSTSFSQHYNIKPVLL